MAPPAKARPKARSRGLGSFEKTTKRLPSTVDRAAAAQTPSATQKFESANQSIPSPVLPARYKIGRRQLST